MSSRLLRSSAVVGALTLISRLLGFVRDLVFAQVFGAGPATDAFFVAFKIPNFLRRLFAEGAFSQAFVPVLSEFKTKRSHVEVRRLIADVSGALGGVLVVVTALAMIASPLLVFLFAPGFADDPAQFDLANGMLRITFPYLLLVSLTALAGGVLNSYGRFAAPALSPVLLNLLLIGAALWGSKLFAVPVTALAWGVFAAGVAQLLFMLPFLARLGLLVRPRWDWSDEAVRRILRLMGPAIFGSSVAQVNLLLNTVIASFLTVGSLSWLYYSDRLVEFPIGVFGVAVGTVILPNLSQRHAEASGEAFSRTLDWGVQLALTIALPATVGLVVLAGPLTTSLFQYGEFGAHDAHMASLSLMTYALGLPAFILVKVLAPGFYARQDTRTPVKVGLISVASNIAFSLLVVAPLVWYDAPAPHAWLALGTALASYVNAGLLFRLLRREAIFQPTVGWRVYGVKLLLANLAMALLLWWGAGDMAHWSTLAAPARVGWLALLVAGGALLYFALLRLLGVRLAQFAGRHV